MDLGNFGKFQAGENGGFCFFKFLCVAKRALGALSSSAAL